MILKGNMLSKMQSRNMTHRWNHFVKQLNQDDNNLTSQLRWQRIDEHTWSMAASGHDYKILTNTQIEHEIQVWNLKVQSFIHSGPLP